MAGVVVSGSEVSTGAEAIHQFQVAPVQLEQAEMTKVKELCARGTSAFDQISTNTKESSMRAMNEARKIIETDPESKEAKTLGELVLALESGSGFTITKIYDLDYKAFELALAVISRWRLQRHYSKKFRLIDMAVHAEKIRPHFER